MQRNRQQTLELVARVSRPTHVLNFTYVYEDKTQIIAVLTLHDNESDYDALFVTSDVEASMTIDQRNRNAKPVTYYVLVDDSVIWIDLTGANYSIINSLDTIKHVTSKMQKIYAANEFDVECADSNSYRK